MTGLHILAELRHFRGVGVLSLIRSTTSVIN